MIRWCKILVLRWGWKHLKYFWDCVLVDRPNKAVVMNILQSVYVRSKCLSLKRRTVKLQYNVWCKSPIHQLLCRYIEMFPVTLQTCWLRCSAASTTKSVRNQILAPTVLSHRNFNLTIKSHGGCIWRPTASKQRSQGDPLPRPLQQER